MNEGAMASYMNDLARGASDFTTKQISARAEEAAAKAAYESTSNTLTHSGTSRSNQVTIGPKVDPLAITLPEDEAARKAKELKVEIMKKESLWCEAVTDEGYTYYWNVKNGESKWEAPKEGYMTLKEYEEIQKVGEQKLEEYAKKEFSDNVKYADEIAAALKREQYKKIGAKITRKEKEKQKETGAEEESKDDVQKFGWEDPETAARPLGKWQVVETKPTETYVDLELPSQSFQPVYVPAANQEEQEPPVKRFKEKTVTTVDAEEPGFFKKRKIAGGSRNVRKRLDDN